MGQAQAVTDRPRFRNDLVAQPIEEEGVRYVDVTDPNSGATFRFYDVEYSIACAMDGDRDLEGLAQWTLTELGIETNPDELAGVVSTLAELGYLDALAVGEGLELGAPGGAGDGFGEEPPAPSADDVELGPPGASPMGTPRPNAPVSAADLELGPPGMFDGAPAESDEAAPLPDAQMELGAPGMGDGTAEEPGMEAPEAPAMEMEAGEPADLQGDAGQDEYPPPEESTKEFNSLAATGEDATATREFTGPPKKSPEELSFAGLMEDEEQTKQLPALTEGQIEKRKSTGGVQKLGQDEPTNLPAPSPSLGADEEDEEEDVSVDLSAHLSLDKNQVKEAVRASRVMAIPELPADMDEGARKEAAAAIVAQAEEDAGEPATAVPAVPSAIGLSAMSDAATARKSSERAAEKAPEKKKDGGAVTLPSSPPSVSKPIEATKQPGAAAMQPGAKKSGSSVGTMILILVLLLAAGGAAYYFLVMNHGDDGGGGSKPPSSSSKGAPGAGAPAGRDDNGAPQAGTGRAGAGPAAKLEAAPGGDELKIASAGKVSWTATDGASVKSGDPLVKLGGSEKLEKELAEVTDRAKFYGEKLVRDQAAKNAPAIAEDQAKVDEKQKLIKDTQAKLDAFIVRAPSDGTVQILVGANAFVSAGDPVVRVGGGPGALEATFTVDPAPYAPQSACAVAERAAPDRQFACVVQKSDAGKVTVRLVAGAPAKAGDDVVLLPAKP